MTYLAECIYWQWHVFYVDSSNIIQEAINSNTTNSWVSGPLGSFRFRVSDGSGAGLTACSNDEFYGTTLGTSGGIRLFYGASNTTAQELVWTYGSTSWTRGYTFSNANGNGGLSCQGVGSGITYLYLLNLNSRIELRWKEFNTAAINSTSHPIGVWNKGICSPLT